MTGTPDRGNHLLVRICIPLLMLSAIFSYYRFVVARDYIVEYEGMCDPAVESCFVACEDEACEEVYYHTLVVKHAADLYAACGPDISECEEARSCQAGDRVCAITHCELEEVGEDESCASFVDDVEESEEEMATSTEETV